MTTIAYRDGVLAADSRATSNGWREHDSAEKVFELNGCLAAVSGDYANAMRMARWFANQGTANPNFAGHNQPDVDTCRLVVVYPGRAVRIFETGSYFDLPGDTHFAAWGSGAPAALACMYAGLGAVDAVRYAACVDPNTGGLIRSIRFDTGGRIITECAPHAPASPPSRSE